MREGPSGTSAADPTPAAERITALDAVRGVAVLGILTMNAVSYGLDPAAYFNIDAQGSDSWLDLAIGGAGEIFFDQKFMGLFSLLFGAGIVLFADRAAAKGRSAGWFSLWRNTLLLLIGIGHTLIWEGDILIVYAICAPVLIAARNRSPRLLFGLGVGIVLLSAVLAAVVQAGIGDDGEGLGTYWFLDGDGSDAVYGWLIADFFLRGLGMMLIGVALYRSSVVTGQRSTRFYRRLAAAGLGLGVPLAALGFALLAAEDFSTDLALLAAIPNTVATIPVVLGYLSLIVLWDRGGRSIVHRRVRAAGRMALTNYLTQTIIGVIVLRAIFDSSDLSRSWILLFILAVWTLQLLWSEPWLSRFRFGPFEWLWRSATYRRWQSLRRDPAPIERSATP